MMKCLGSNLQGSVVNTSISVVCPWFVTRKWFYKTGVRGSLKKINVHIQMTSISLQAWNGRCLLWQIYPFSWHDLWKEWIQNNSRVFLLCHLLNSFPVYLNLQNRVSGFSNREANARRHLCVRRETGVLRPRWDLIQTLVQFLTDFHSFSLLHVIHSIVSIHLQIDLWTYYMDKRCIAAVGKLFGSGATLISKIWQVGRVSTRQI